MAIPKNKLELVAAIQINYAKLKVDLESVTADAAMLQELEGHAKDTTMSVANLTAYLIGWGELVLKWHRKRENKETVHFPEEAYQWNELGLLAQKFYKDYADKDYPTLLKMLDETVAKILQVVENQTDAQLYQQPFYNQYPLGRMIQLNTSSPYKNARTRVRKWKRTRQNS